jgi:hypothetical protein
MYPQISKKIISKKNIRFAKKMVLAELTSLQADYYPELTMSNFLRNHIYPSSPMSIRLQSRCFFKGLAEKIISDDLLKFIKEHIDSFTLYHLVFLRVHHPNTLSSISVTSFNSIFSFSQEIFKYIPLPLLMSLLLR